MPKHYTLVLMSARPARQKERREHSMAIGLYLFLIMCVMDERVFVYACVEWGTGAIGPFAVNSNLIR